MVACVTLTLTHSTDYSVVTDLLWCVLLTLKIQKIFDIV